MNALTNELKWTPENGIWNSGRAEIRGATARVFDLNSPDKVGTDVGEICGIGPIGLAATDDVEALTALRPDALVHFGPTAAHADANIRDIGSFLRAGIDVCSDIGALGGGGAEVIGQVPGFDRVRRDVRAARRQDLVHAARELPGQLAGRCVVAEEQAGRCRAHPLS